MTLKAACVCVAAAVWPALAQETVVVLVGPAGVERPIEIELRSGGVIRTAAGILYQGEAAVLTPLGRLALAQSELVFGYAPGTEQVESVRGRAFVPAPLSGDVVSIENPVMAEVGYDLGANLKSLQAPLVDNRGYLFFKFDAGLTMRFGKAPPEGSAEEDVSFTLSFGPGAEAKIVIDPMDPMYYFAGGVMTPNKKKPAEKPQEDGDEETGGIFGTGSSRRGLFPFRPLVTWGIEDKAREFMGHRIQTGTFPLYTLPISVSGHLIANLDPLATGKLAVDPLGIGFGPVAQAGANGRFAFTLDFLKATPLGGLLSLDLTVPLGKATAAVEIVSDRQLAYVSGIVDPAMKYPAALMLSGDGELKAAALVSTTLEDSRLLMEGWYKVSPNELSRALGIDLGNVFRVEGSLRADRTGLFLHGAAERGMYMGPLRASGALLVDVGIPAQNPQNRYFQLGGAFHFAGMGTDGLARVSREGFLVSGKLTAPQFDMSIDAGVTPQDGGTVFGRMSVPAALQPDLNGEIQKAAAQAQQEIDRKLTALQQATRDYEFELSLRGMRQVVPPVTDAIVAEINRQIPANINARWPKLQTLFGPVEAPGKDAAIALANNVAEPYRDRLRNLKRQMQTGDSAQARAALEAAIRDVLANSRLRVTFTVPIVNVTITIIDYPIVSSSLQQQLNLALAGVRALPETSNVKIQAELAWTLLPKREILRAAADAITRNATAAIPRIETIGFRFPLGRAEWDFQAVVTVQGARSAVTVRLAPDGVGSIGRLIGQAFAQLL